MSRRSPSEHLRIYGPPEYRAWVDAQDCFVLGCETSPYGWRPDRRGYREICHARNGGRGRKADFKWTFVACWVHHDATSARRTFEQAYAGRLAVRGLEWLVSADTLMEAATLTHAAFRDSELGRAWLARIEAGLPPTTGGLEA